MIPASIALRSATASEPATATNHAEPAARSTSELLELLLKDQTTLDALLRDETAQRQMIPKLLGIAVSGFALYGLTATLMLNLAHNASGFWLLGVPPAFWNGPSAANLTLAYCLGLIAANGICLPSFYFYGLLAGVRVSMVGVTAHALKGMAAGAIALVAMLPLYVAVSLSVMMYATDPVMLGGYAVLALLLPFLAGLWGARCLYRGFVALADTLCETSGRRRACLLRRLILAWSGCYAFVTPLTIYALWQHLAAALH